MKEINLNSGVLYMIVGLPAAGKSSLLKNNNIPEQMILSSDDFRKRFFGETYFNNDNGVYPVPNFFGEDTVFNIINKVLEVRLKEKLTTFLDITCLVEQEERNKYKKVAEAYGMSVEIIHVNSTVEQSIINDSLRKYKVGRKVIENFNKKFSLESETAPIHNVNYQTKINLLPNTLPHDKYDIIGDVHGLYDETIKLITKLGYKADNQGVYRHSEGRNLLFLGDFVDRGTQSVDLLRFFLKQHNNTNDKFILGNHENKILNFFKYYERNNKKIEKLATAPALTCSALLKIEKTERDEILNLLNKMPAYYLYNNIAFVHANLVYFDPIDTPASYMLYGDEYKSIPHTKNSDLAYSEIFGNLNHFYLVRGHIRNTDENQNVVLSLEENSAFSGQLCAVRLEDLQESIKLGKGVNNKDILYREKVDFNFNDYRKDLLSLYYKIQALNKENLVSVNYDEENFLQIFKYKKDVFFNKKWEQFNNLLGCRGIVFDFAGNLVQYPFDKIFNYGEPNEKGELTATNLDLNKNYIAVEKLNGFFGAITKHPFKNDLLCTTTGSLDSPFVEYIKELVREKKHYSNLMKLVNKTPDVTYMFEVIHKDDPHIVKYNEDQFDIYLIGARKKVEGSPLYTEQELDLIGKEYNLKRPVWVTLKLSSILEQLKTVEHEGFMIRDIESGETLFKGKSDYYLSVKFLSRLSDNKIKHMYNNPDNFKKSIEEEGFVLVDYILNRYTKEEFLEFDDEKRKEAVKKAISDINESYSNKAPLKSYKKHNNKRIAP